VAHLDADVQAAGLVQVPIGHRHQVDGSRSGPDLVDQDLKLLLGQTAAQTAPDRSHAALDGGLAGALDEGKEGREDLGVLGIHAPKGHLLALGEDPVDLPGLHPDPRAVPVQAVAIGHDPQTQDPPPLREALDQALELGLVEVDQDLLAPQRRLLLVAGDAVVLQDRLGVGLGQETVQGLAGALGRQAGRHGHVDDRFVHLPDDSPLLQGVAELGDLLAQAGLLATQLLDPDQEILDRLGQQGECGQGDGGDHGSGQGGDQDRGVPGTQVQDAHLATADLAPQLVAEVGDGPGQRGHDQVYDQDPSD